MLHIWKKTEGNADLTKTNRTLTDKEKLFIEESVGKLNTNQIAKKLDRSYKAVKAYLDRLGERGVDLTGTRRREWTKEEHDYIIENHLNKTGKEIARDLGVTPEDITSRIKVLRRRGLLEKRKSPGFTEEEIEYIRENKSKLSGSEIARRLGRSRTAVNEYIREMEGR